MPHLQVTAKGHDWNRSLGWLACEWIEHYVLYGRGDVTGQPVRLTREVIDFIVGCYAVDENGRRLYDSAFLSRPKGCDKSGIASYIALFEALGPCRGTGEFAEGGEVYTDRRLGSNGKPFRHVFEPGEPFGRRITAPFLRCLATEEGQVGNVYDSVYYNLTEGPLAAWMVRPTDAGLTRVFLPESGEVRPSTSSSASKDGGLETFVDFDETHLYTTPELRRMYALIKRNLRKRKKIAETWYLETTTMYAPGEDSVAESTYKVAELIKSGKLKRDRLFLDHRWGELDADDLGDEQKLRAALTEAYGDALEWNDLDGLVNEVYDPETDIADSIRYFLNDRYSPGTSWLSEAEVRGAVEAGKDRHVQPGEPITLGFDGSRGRARGKPDATALIGCCVSDGHLFEIGVWEAGEVTAEWSKWEPPILEIEAALQKAFTTYRVIGFYADPAKDWRSYVDAWEARWVTPLKAGPNHPFEWWMTGGRATQVERAVEQLEGAIRNRDVSMDGSFRLVQHLLNARRRLQQTHLALGKENEYSPHKIDAAVAAVLAYQARLNAVAKGFGAATNTELIRAR